MRPARLFLLTVALVSVPSLARALDVVVTSCGNDTDFFAKLSAVQTAGSGSIKFSCGASPAAIVLSQPALITFGPLLIDGGNKVTLSGGNSNALFLVGQNRSLILKRLTVTLASSGTGAIEVFANGRLKATSVTFEDNHSTTSGGALYAVSGAKLKIKRCTFSQNSADSSGGAIAAFSANVNVQLSTFSEGSATVFGGAIYANASTTFVKRTQFLVNDATSDGGAIYLDRGSLTVRRNTVFVGNLVEDFEGGAIANVKGDVDIRDASFTENGAKLRGGAISSNGVLFPDDIGTLTVQRATFQRNGVDTDDVNSVGGAIYNHAYAYLTDVAILDSGAYKGGAVYAEQYELQIARSTMAGNLAKQAGGAIYTDGAKLTVTNATFYDDTAIAGGALLIDQADGSVTNATFSHNTANTTGSNLYAANADASRFKMVNSIVEVDPVAVDSCFGNWTSLGHNLFFGDSSCGGIASDVVNNPKLGMIGSNGGFTDTLLPASDSDAVDGGDTAKCPADDQRGIARPIGLACDIGAVEQ